MPNAIPHSQPGKGLAAARSLDDCNSHHGMLAQAMTSLQAPAKPHASHSDTQATKSLSESKAATAVLAQGPRTPKPQHASLPIMRLIV